MSKRKVCLLSVLFCFACNKSMVFAQDSLFFKNGKILATKVLKVYPMFIEYKFFDTTIKTTFTKSKSELFKIKYQDGQIEFNETNFVLDTIKIAYNYLKRPSYYSKRQMDSIGKLDASEYFTDKYSNKTFLFSLFLTPIVGGVIATNDYRKENTKTDLNMPNSNLKDSVVYINAYKQKAMKMKKSDITSNYFPVLLLYLVTPLLFIKF